MCGAERESEVLRSPDPLTSTAVGPQSKGHSCPSLHLKPAHSSLENTAVKEGRDFPGKRISVWVHEARLSGVPRLRCAHTRAHTHTHARTHLVQPGGMLGRASERGPWCRSPKGQGGVGRRAVSAGM